MVDALAAIELILPKVLKTEAAMDATLLGFARSKTEAAANGARKQAADSAAFNTSLERAGVGELFALADERKSKGDTQRAREALRKLMSRFPDHKLATLAAGMLTELQGK